MAFNQVHCMEALAAATASGASHEDFIYSFLDAYGFPKATITQLRTGSSRNVATRQAEGHVGLKNWLYFMPPNVGESVHEALQRLADDDLVARHKTRFQIVTDFEQFTARDSKTDERIECAFADLPGHYLFFAPMAGLERVEKYPEASADVKAAAKMGKLFERLRESNEFQTPDQLHSLNVFLTRLLFCYFAEDTEIFDKGTFTRLIAEASSEDGDELPELLTTLFRVLNQPLEERAPTLPAHLAQFPYVNGGLFAQELPVPSIRAKARRMMIECGQLNWSQTNPDIFGSMFQAVVDEESRDAFGQHYTSVPNILKVIQPLFLEKLTSELKSARGNRKRLQALLIRLTRLRIFDPAMGSGNFLIIAYKELRRLEMAVFRELEKVSRQNEMFMSGIRLSQFYGIEIDDFAHEIAILSMWLVEHQMNMAFRAEFGHAEPTLPLKQSGNLVLGNSLLEDWQAICPRDEDYEIYICGNPPFIGHGNRSNAQLSEMKSVLGQAIKKYKSLDYVACWFYLAANYCRTGSTEAAFVSTNSLCQGKQASLLWPSIIRQGTKISFAYQTFSWSNSAKKNAGVHVIVVGLTHHEKERSIYKKVNDQWHKETVDNISPYLVRGSNTVISESRKSFLKGARPMLFGNMPNDGGYLLMTTDERDALLAIEPSAQRWIRRLIGADEFIKGKERWCLWLADAHADDIEAMPAVKNLVEQVREKRLLSSDAGTRKLAERPHQFRDLNNPDSYILVPRVTSERRYYAPVGFFNSDVIANDAVQIIPNGTHYDFAILSTRLHMDWLRLVGGRLESRYRYSATIVYNTFPWPDATDAQKAEIERLGRNVLLARECHPGSTMAELYDPDLMPQDLLAAHQALDVAVELLYRDKPFRDMAERQTYLLARYETLIAAEKKSAKSAVEKRKTTRTPKTRVEA
ncbi:N-6 DNA methylase [Kushneria sinocarnis]|uniref:site-specific DNA-methyltransferase (adenine-specific) n=1 Tax=Kushneria sinocarnis TaxID=595502 RepID=A0A420X1K6_9GAMM|nr:DNA methyltransferase [Kushneria sinocarnis]RKR07627.1 N-6 DNA methylase [Kushneria sinocarnis]